MIKARGLTDDGTHILLLGLSFANLDRLRAGEPIEFDGTPYGYHGEIILFAGTDERTMARRFIVENPDVLIHTEKGAP